MDDIMKLPCLQRRRPVKYMLRKAVASALTTIILATAGISGIAAEAKNLIPVGRAVGIRLESEGVIIVGIPDFCADGKTASPAKGSGLKAGDIITKVGAMEITCGEDLKAMMDSTDGRPLVIWVTRDGKTAQSAITPHKTENGTYSLGIMVRDGVSGIGTVTFYDPETGSFGALGHAVNDGDTGVLMPVREGYISHVSVTDVAKGKTGTPGQLHGSFDFDKKVGSVEINTDCGIYGQITYPALACEAPMPVADESEIHTGEAYILSNITGNMVKKYSAEVSRVYKGDESDGRSMLITITDPDLKEATGGIVQGMSGSPIIQDGKIIGAVTHVLINDPTKGYGIAITRMLENIEDLEIEENEAEPNAA